MSKASKARRASYRRQERQAATLGWSWSFRESGEGILHPEKDDLGQAHVMHQVSPNAQHMNSVQSFACFRAGDKAYMMGQAGIDLPATLSHSVYFRNMHTAGKRAKAKQEAAALNKAQYAAKAALYARWLDDEGIVDCDNNRKLFEQLLEAEKQAQAF